MPGRMQAVHELGQQLQSTNVASERQQELEALPVVATDDRQTKHYRKT
jgi:hypothetical protein